MRDRADIDAHLHGGGAVEDVNFAGFELALIATELRRRLLGRVFSGSEIVRVMRDPVADVCPGAQRTHPDDGRLGV